MRIVSGMAWLVVVVLAAGSPYSSAADWLELTDLTLFDGTGAPARAVERLLVRDGVVVAIEEVGGSIQALSL